MAKLGGSKPFSVTVAAGGTSNYPSSGTYTLSSHSALGDSVIIQPTSTSGWFGNNFVTGDVAISTLYFDTGSAAINAHQAVAKSSITTASPSPTHLYYRDSNGISKGNYRYFEANLGFTDTNDANTFHPNRSDSVAYVPKWDFVLSSAIDLDITDSAAVHTRVDIQMLSSQSSLDRRWIPVNGLIQGSSVKSFGIQQANPIRSSNGVQRVRWLFDELKWRGADRSQVAAEATSTGPVSGFIPADEPYNSSNAAEFATLDESSGKEKVVVDLRPEVRNINWFRQEKSLLDFGFNRDELLGTTDVYEKLQQVLEAKISDGDRLKFPPEANLLLNVNQPLYLRDRNVALNFQGATLLNTIDRAAAVGVPSTAQMPVLRLAGSKNELFDLRIFGAVSYQNSTATGNLASSWTLGNAFTETTATTSTSGDLRTLDGQNAAARSDLAALAGNTIEGMWARRASGLNTAYINLSSSNSGIAKIDFTDEASNLLAMSDISITDSGGTFYTSEYMTVPSAETSFTVAFRTEQDDIHSYLRVTKVDSTGGRITIHRGTVDGHLGTNVDTHHGIDIVAGANNNLVRGYYVEGMHGDGVHVANNAFNNAIENFYVRMVGRQGVSAVQDLGTVFRHGEIVGTGRSGIDLESGAASDFIKRGVLEDIRISHTHLGGVTGVAGDQILHLDVNNIRMYDMPDNVFSFQTGGITGTVNNVVQYSGRTRNTGAKSEIGLMRITGRNTTFNGFQNLLNRGSVKIEPTDAQEGYLAINHLKAGNGIEVSQHDLTVFSATIGELTDSTLDLNNVIAGSTGNGPMPVRVVNATDSNIWFGFIDPGMFGKRFYKQTFGGTPIGMAPRYLGGQDLFNESITRVGGVSYAGKQRAKGYGRHTGINASAGTLSVQFSDAQYQKANITENSTGFSAMAEGSTGGTLQANSSYYYWMAVLHPNGGNNSVTLPFANVATAAGSSNDRRIQWEVADLKGRFQSTAYESLTRNIRFWRSLNSSTTPTHYADVRLTSSNKVSQLGGYFARTQRFRDNGASMQIFGTENTVSDSLYAWSGYPNAGSFAWSSVNVPDMTLNLTGAEIDSNYMVFPSAENVNVGAFTITNKTMSSFTVTWSDTTAAGSTFTLNYELRGISS